MLSTYCLVFTTIVFCLLIETHVKDVLHFRELFNITDAHTNEIQQIRDCFEAALNLLEAYSATSCCYHPQHSPSTTSKFPRVPYGTTKCGQFQHQVQKFLLPFCPIKRKEIRKRKSEFDQYSKRLRKFNLFDLSALEYKHS